MSDLISRQAAIDVVHWWYKNIYGEDAEKWICESIENLPSAQPSQKNDSNTLKALDCVSRKAVIDVIKEFQHGASEWRDEQEECSDIWHRADSAIASAIEIGLRVKKLPSAQPDKNMIHLQKEQAYMQGWEDGRRKMLSAHPEIIRCKDCKHRPKRLEEGEGEGFNIEFPDYKCPCQCDDGWYNWMPDDNWFCGNGERRTDG